MLKDQENDSNKRTKKPFHLLKVWMIFSVFKTLIYIHKNAWIRMQIGYRFKNYTVSRFINSVKQFINNMGTTDIGLDINL